MSKVNANVNNNSTALGINVDCLTPNGAIVKYMEINAGFGKFRAVSMPMDDGARNIHVQTQIENGKMNVEIEGKGCKTPHGAVKKVSASAILPPKVLNAGKKPAKYQAPSLGMNKF